MLGQSVPWPEGRTVWHSEAIPVNVPSIHETRRQMYRMQIISAAEYEFARAGFEKTKVANIARTADVSLATLYKYFAGKDEIWDVLNQQRVDA
jgi:AcrR family transcriptional regulator